MMKSVSAGDVIFHLLKQEKGQGYFLVGHSIAASGAQTIKDEPPIPTDWAGMSPYYRIPVTSFMRLAKPVSIQSVFEQNKAILEEGLKNNSKGRFFEQKSDGRLQVSLRYIANADDIVSRIFSNLVASQGQQLGKVELESFLPTKENPAYPDYTPPGSVRTEISRRIRDTALSREVKRKFGFKCAVCNLVIKLPREASYAEAHHLKPLGAGHDGPDTADNIIVLCPNHHAEFDYGVIAIDPEKKTLMHRDPTNPWHGKVLAYPVNHLSQEFIWYHLAQIFLPQK